MPIKQVWLEENIILIKNVQIWVNKKMLKNPMKKKFSIIYQRTKVQKFGSLKNDRVEKT
jgi:nitrogen fixation protein